MTPTAGPCRGNRSAPGSPAGPGRPPRNSPAGAPGKSSEICKPRCPAARRKAGDPPTSRGTRPTVSIPRRTMRLEKPPPPAGLTVRWRLPSPPRPERRRSERKPPARLGGGQDSPSNKSWCSESGDSGQPATSPHSPTVAPRGSRARQPPATPPSLPPARPVRSTYAHARRLLHLQGIHIDKSIGGSPVFVRQYGNYGEVPAGVHFKGCPALPFGLAGIKIQRGSGDAVYGDIRLAAVSRLGINICQ